MNPMNPMNPVFVRLRRFVYEARTEGEGPGREAAAIGAGVFIGCSPFYGLHLAICLLVGWLFRLNRLKLYLASNISNPLFAPVLILGELQIGAWLRRGEWHSLTIETARTTDPWIFGGDLLLGSVVIGGVLGALTALATWLSTRAPDTSPLAPIVRRAADRYIGTSITAWEFARGKLRGDPIYAAALSSPVLPSGGTLVDVGCGQGLMLALLAEAARAWNGGQWPAGLPPPPRADRLIGIETRRGVAALARRALAGEAEIIEADARTRAPAQCRAVLLFDVLHMMPRADQEQLLTSIARVLDPGGVILVREADAAAGWRFRAVHAGNRLKALVTGNWSQTFHFRSEAEWQKLFERFGFRVSRFTAGDGTPFGNVLFSLTESRSASASAIQSSQTV
jgi:uncharacterized protein (DUF2062 family)/ubiquinone/menaquinone biosynthesis C-methylase UbiE